MELKEAQQWCCEVNSCREDSCNKSYAVSDKKSITKLNIGEIASMAVFTSAINPDLIQSQTLC